MIRKTYTILAAAALTTSACAGTVSTDRQPSKAELAQELSNTTPEEAAKNREHFAPLCDGDGYPLPGNINSKQSAYDAYKLSRVCDPQTPPATTPGPSTSPAPACDQNALNQELSGIMLEAALTQSGHFRCLCDDKGYPLVGNLNGKVITTASAFCGALREKGKL
jgi:hypothetical protein